jgi:hypothetical protein
MPESHKKAKAFFKAVFFIALLAVMRIALAPNPSSKCVYTFGEYDSILFRTA